MASAWFTVGWLPVHRDQLRAQRSVTSVGELYLLPFSVGMRCRTDTQTNTQTHRRGRPLGLYTSRPFWRCYAHNDWEKLYDMIWYDMTILMCAQKLTDASLIYRTGPKTKTSKMKNTKKQTDMLRRNGAGQESMESVRKREGSLGWKWFVEQEGFEVTVLPGSATESPACGYVHVAENRWLTDGQVSTTVETAPSILRAESALLNITSTLKIHCVSIKNTPQHFSL